MLIGSGVITIQLCPDNTTDCCSVVLSMYNYHDLRYILNRNIYEIENCIIIYQNN